MEAGEGGQWRWEGRERAVGVREKREGSGGEGEEAVEVREGVSSEVSSGGERDER